ncbi:hypothetical protein [Arthrobacter sp. R-11]|uniref:hypothetical protein n=1 Tax=Arthrobacter sp. R-11 TaxID=3404053 RepID=UPI003CEF2256
MTLDEVQGGQRAPSPAIVGGAWHPDAMKRAHQPPVGSFVPQTRSAPAFTGSASQRLEGMRNRREAGSVGEYHQYQVSMKLDTYDTVSP